MKRSIIILALLLGPLSLMADSQGTPSTVPGAGGNVPPAPPIFTALDANHDGVISASEIATATAALKKLDKNADGMLSPDEYIPPRPGETAAPAGAVRAAAPPRPDKTSGKGDDQNRPPKPPIDLVLDANSDGVISASEIASAAAALKKLDKNADGRLTSDECLPERPKKFMKNQTEH